MLPTEQIGEIYRVGSFVLLASAHQASGSKSHDLLLLGKLIEEMSRTVAILHVSYDAIAKDGKILFLPQSTQQHTGRVAALSLYFNDDVGNGTLVLRFSDRRFEVRTTEDIRSAFNSAGELAKCLVTSTDGVLHVR